MQSMFQNQRLFNQDIGTKEVTVNGVTYTAWDTSNVTSMNVMFYINSTAFAGSFNNGDSDSIKNWNTSKVADMYRLFRNQPVFNQPINTQAVTVGSSTYTAWDTLNVTNMEAMLFSGLALGAFNQNICNWNTSKVTTMSTMFAYQGYLNQDIGTKVVTVNGVTYTAWNTSNVTTFYYMLGNTSSFGAGSFNNGDSDSIKNWNTSKATDIRSLFQNQPNFNQDVGTKVVTVNGLTYTAWDTLNVTSLDSVFVNFTQINQGLFNNGGSDSIKNWNTSKVTNLNYIFEGQVNFNQDISTKSVTINGSTYSAWSTTNVTTMNSSFSNATAFNSNIGSWNTAKVTNMTSMLYGTTNFNQNLSSWNVSLVTVFNGPTLGFANLSGISTANYDALLIGWATRAVKPNLAINFGIIKYTSASISARLILISAPNNWTIVDGGLE
jgi:surface protein